MADDICCEALATWGHVDCLILLGRFEDLAEEDVDLRAHYRLEGPHGTFRNNFPDDALLAAVFCLVKRVEETRTVHEARVDVGLSFGHTGVEIDVY